MITEKLLEYVRRQTLLAAKVEDGTVTADERAEFTTVNAAIKAATEPQTVDAATFITTMTLGDFKKHVDAEVGALEANQDAERLALLQRNIANVKEQGKTLATDIVGVEIQKEKEPADRLKELEDIIAELSLKLESNETEKGDKPIAQALALEAITTLATRFEGLRTKIEGGALTEADLKEAFDGNWELRSALDQAVAIMAKADGLAKTLAPVVEAMQKMDKGEDTSEDADADDKGDTDANADTDADADTADTSADTDTDADDADADADDAGDSDDVDKNRDWASDLAPDLDKGNEGYQILKGKSSKREDMAD